MYIACVKNSGKPYLNVSESYSVKVNGATKIRKRVIRNIGPLSRFDDGKPDFLERLRQSFKEGAPIIEGLDDLVAGRPLPDKVTVEFDRNNAAAAFSSPKNIGYFLLDSLYDKLGIYDVLNKHKSSSRVRYDLNGHAKLLIFGRVLSPDSKCATWRGRDGYLFDVVSSGKQIEVYRALDVLDTLSVQIQKRMNRKISDSAVGRDMDICYYDVTNYWFEIDGNDEDEVDDKGAVLREGLRKKGVSKKKTSDPIVQMGLFIDDNGIPVSYKLFPGNHTDQTTLRPTMRETLDKMGLKRAVIIADGGLNNGPNIAHILKEGNGYIVSKSTKKSDKAVKAWMLDESGYVWAGEKQVFKSKSTIRTRTIKDEDGEPVEIREKLVCYWSKKHYDHERSANRKFIEYLEAVIENPDKLKDKEKKIQKYLKKTEVVKETGEVVDTVTRLDLDMDKIRRDIDLMGYYTVMTSETDMPDREVIDKYHGLSRIEDSFKVIKSDLDGRPVFVRIQEHINAHFLICFIALTMIRIIQHKLLVAKGKETKGARDWETGLSADKIKRALDCFAADALPGGYFRLSKPGADIDMIMDAIGVAADLRIPTEHDLRQLKYAIDKADIL
jgi:transposase